MRLKKFYSLLKNDKVPMLGVLCFTILYFYSSTSYPGGSQANLTSEGFDWLNNYWCNLMNEISMNGESSPARPFSILAMVILCYSLMIFFLKFATVFATSKLWEWVIKISGIISMFFATLIFTKYHDLMTILSSVFGLLVLIGIVKAIYKSEMRTCKISGVLCVLLIGLNNYIYYTTNYLEFLPLLQKVAFAVVLIWILGLNYNLIKINRNQRA